MTLLNNQIRGKEYTASLLSKRISGRMKKFTNMDSKTKENDNERKERIKSGIKENTDHIDKLDSDK